MLFVYGAVVCVVFHFHFSLVRLEQKISVLECSFTECGVKNTVSVFNLIVSLLTFWIPHF